MNKSKREQELETLISSLVPTPANLLVSQAGKKAKKIQDTSGQILLELSKSANPLGLLEKTLVDTLNSVSTPSLRTWRVLVTTQGHLLFQLHPSVHGTKGKESGLWATPNTMDHLPPRSPEGTKKLQEGHRKGRTKPSNLREQVDPETMRMYPTPRANEPGRTTKGYGRGLAELMEGKQQMYPTPRACDLEGGVVKNVDLRNGSFSRKNKKGVRYGVKLKDAVHHLEKMYPTPTSSEHKYRLKGNSQASNCLEAQARRTGGKLNPNFVEFLMGFPMDWTKVESEESKD